MGFKSLQSVRRTDTRMSLLSPLYRCDVTQRSQQRRCASHTVTARGGQRTMTASIVPVDDSVAQLRRQTHGSEDGSNTNKESIYRVWLFTYLKKKKSLLPPPSLFALNY